MFYIIEQNTDSRDPRTKVYKVRSRSMALELAEEDNLGFAFPGAARANAIGGSNYHQRLREVYEVVGVREPSPAALRKKAEAQSTRDYPCRSIDVLAGWARSNGGRVSVEKRDNG
ncbi:MAG: hypothetical protein M0Z39_05745 [Actinomycetota bacterium]|jgi:hypothetical protein|nr:hypothetical protein [Actinomycetota bacterium]